MRPFPILAAAGLALAVSACNDYDSNESTEPLAATNTNINTSDAADAKELASEAVDVVKKMQRDSDLNRLMAQAEGVFVVPSYGKGAIGVGASGGEGVLLARDGNGWRDPAFYDIGEVSVGPQIGGKGGEIAMLLMTDNALDSFTEDNFSLTADAGFTFFDYTARARETTRDGADVVLWSDTEGAFAGASIGATAIKWDNDENRAYYRNAAVSADDVIEGRITTPDNDAVWRDLNS